MNFDYQYESLNDTLISEGAICSAAELHGMFSGQIAGGRQGNDDYWISQGRDYADLAHFEENDCQKALMLGIVHNTRKSLSADDFRFTPLLPDDACPLPDRSREIGAWCRGFLHGFGTSGVNKDTQLSAELAEVIRDMARFSQELSGLGDDDDSYDEDSERSWVELVEYVRTAVYTVYTEMHENVAEKNTNFVPSNNALH